MLTNVISNITKFEICRFFVNNLVICEWLVSKPLLFKIFALNKHHDNFLPDQSQDGFEPDFTNIKYGYTQ